MNRERKSHTIPPFVPPEAKILILGSFPSVKSRETGFYYGHPKNRFWRVLAEVFGAPCPASLAEKKDLLTENEIALWDVVAACEIRGSADASIQNALPNDIADLIRRTGITRIFINGKTAAALYARLIAQTVDLPFSVLPSTSPANASFDLARLCAAWAILRQ